MFSTTETSVHNVINVKLSLVVESFTLRLQLKDTYVKYTVFRLDALAKALSVIATATWLGGWLSHSGIVSKPLNLPENFFGHLKAPSF